MMMKVLQAFLGVCFLTDFISAQGAPWTQEETEIIAEKILQTKKIGGMKMQEVVVINTLRLGFHDCLPYADQEEGLINGCDGCLDPEEVLTKHHTHYGLKGIVDHLEKIYTDPEFPKGSPALSQSMKNSGKSRADLWAFATLIGALGGMANNNR